MKRIIALTALLVSSSVHADFNDGLVAWYPLAGSLVNQANSEQIASLLPGATLAPESVTVNDGGVLIPAPFSEATSVFSASLYVYEIGLTDTAGGAYLTAGEGISNIPLITHNWVDRLESPQGSYYGPMMECPSNYNACYLLAPLELSSIRNLWVHYVFVSDTSGVSLFKNGVRIGSLDFPGFPVTGDWFLGKQWWLTGGMALVSSGRIIGNFKSMRVYSRALSDQEIANLYALESTPDPCIPHAATAEVTVVNGFVVGATITGGGCGYLEAPVVMIRGSGTGATAVATISNGVVTGITITNAGSGYGEDTRILIASPPFMPSLQIAVSKVAVTLHVVLGKRYVLESSADLTNWTPVGPAFTAEAELLQQEFDVAERGRYFRIQEVP